MAIKRLNMDDPCPCESGKTIRYCCYRGNDVLTPLPAHTLPAGPPTGYSHPRCYAASLRDCSTKISGEHYVSESILELLEDGGGVYVSGLSFLGEGQQKKLPKKSLQAKVLCTRHNSVLSSLDQVGFKLFQKILNMRTVFADTQRDREHQRFLLSGTDTERWMLKLLCGAIAAGTYAPTIFTPLDDQWVRILYGWENFPAGWGLYFLDESREPIPTETAISWSVLWNEDACRVVGVAIWVNGLGFLLSMVPSPVREAPDVFRKALYKPSGLSFTDHKKRKVADDGRVTLQIGWLHGPERCEWINIQMTRVYREHR